MNDTNTMNDKVTRAKVAAARGCGVTTGKRLTPAQVRTIRDILDGTTGSIISIDARVRRELERRGLLPWAGLNASKDEIRRLVHSGPARYGRIDRTKLVSILRAAGCGECPDCQEIMVDPSQVARGLFCPFASATAEPHAK